MVDIEKINIIKTDEPQVCILPNIAAMKVKDFLDQRKIEYRCVGQEKFEDGWPGGCIYRGKEYTCFVQAIITCIDSEHLLEIAEQLYYS